MSNASILVVNTESLNEYTEVEKAVILARRNVFLASATGENLTQVIKYVREAEHQDGYGYWLKFSTDGAVMADFRLYLECSND